MSGAQVLGCLSLPSLSEQQAEWKVEQLGLDTVLVWDASVMGGSLAHCATVLTSGNSEQRKQAMSSLQACREEGVIRRAGSTAGIRFTWSLLQGSAVSLSGRLPKATGSGFDHHAVPWLRSGERLSFAWLRFDNMH